MNSPTHKGNNTGNLFIQTGKGKHSGGNCLYWNGSEWKRSSSTTNTDLNNPSRFTRL